MRKKYRRTKRKRKRKRSINKEYKTKKQGRGRRKKAEGRRKYFKISIGKDEGSKPKARHEAAARTISRDRDAKSPRKKWKDERL